MDGVTAEQTEPPVVIEALTAAHADEVLAIYQAGIDEGNATFETAAPAWEVFDAAKLAEHRFVALDPEGGGAGTGSARTGGSGRVLGWIAVAPVSPRAVYAGVVEHSVYVHPGARGRGVARALLDALIASTEAAGIWTIQAGVFPENTASIAVHLRAGFRAVGVSERVGRHHGTWRDVQLLERRSPVVG
ncbi:phosphinothricin acetyltransferase [Streptomyces abyssalis]|uniref:Phosphinothricin acetyltransferase n=1 Tax=Streptomyces abyssalis TaxID=933944 RepID=A0A1E7JR13_9ACTN|nr:phosphinothricin acetyltransferase [Streptomyces abyssalis]OEU90685.1 phosphinothricin acetyltransferase [Streptomyces abyssalis]